MILFFFSKEKLIRNQLNWLLQKNTEYIKRNTGNFDSHKILYNHKNHVSVLFHRSEQLTFLSVTTIYSENFVVLTYTFTVETFSNFVSLYNITWILRF